MTYDPATYWPERYRRQGETYVAKGGRRDSYEEQIIAVLPHFDWLPSEGRVLDFGCGPGRLRPHLESRGLDYEGVDIIPGLGTMEIEGIEPGSFDCAVAIWVLQHIVDRADYDQALESLHGALSIGGRLLVVDHARRDGMAEHMNPRGAAPLVAWFTSGETGPFDDHHWVGVFRR